MYVGSYRMVQMFDGGNFDAKFDESKLYRQKFPSQYFAVEINNFKSLFCNIVAAQARVCTDRKQPVFQLRVTKP